MDLQQFIENVVITKRNKTFSDSDQLSLGTIIKIIKSIIDKGYECHDGSEPTVCYGFGYMYPTSIDSWRGSYNELALNYVEDGMDNEMKLTDFYNMLNNAVDKVFQGWKGGDFRMTENTPVWVSNPGNASNTAVIAIVDKGYKVKIETGFRDFLKTQMKTLITFCIAAGILILTTSQTKAPTIKKPKVSDSTLIISIKDLTEFNALLKQSVSYDNYIKLTPEATLQELANWKLSKMADTTKVKK